MTCFQDAVSKKRKNSLPAYNVSWSQDPGNFKDIVLRLSRELKNFDINIVITICIAFCGVMVNLNKQMVYLLIYSSDSNNVSVMDKGKMTRPKKIIEEARFLNKRFPERLKYEKKKIIL